MQYRIVKKDDRIEIKGSSRRMPKLLSESGFLLPSKQEEDATVFTVQGGIKLHNYITLISEERFLYCVYSLAKYAETVYEKSGGTFQFLLDTQCIFCNEKSIDGIVVPLEQGEPVDYKSFFWNLLFSASYETENIPIILELLSFIRSARTIEPRDIVLFIEMGTLGKKIMQQYAQQHTDPARKQNVNGSDTDVSALPQAGKDYSDFLSGFDLISEESEIEDETPNDSEKEERARLSDEDQSNIDFLMNFDFVDDETDESKVGFGKISPDDIPQELLSEISNLDPAVFREAVQSELKDRKERSETNVSTETSSQNDEVGMDEFLSENHEIIHESESTTYNVDSEEHEESVDPGVDVQDEVLDEVLPEELFGLQKEDDSKRNITPANPQESQNQEDKEKGKSEGCELAKPQNSETPEVRLGNKIQPVKPSREHDLHSANQVDPVAKANVGITGRFGTSGKRTQISETNRKKYYLIAKDGRSVEIAKMPFTIGRAPSGVDLTVQDVYVSRSHAQLIQSCDNCYLIDLHPRNPSFINEKVINPDEPHLLHDEDRIRFGKTVYYFRCITIKE